MRTFKLFPFLLGATALFFVGCDKSSEQSHKISLSRIPNAQNSGEVVLILRGSETDQPDVFIWNSTAKGRNQKLKRSIPLRYSSTQGSERLVWSRDKMMVAVYDESALRYNESSPWSWGYSWSYKRLLKPQEMTKAFSKHGGKGEVVNWGSFRPATPEEVALLDLKNP